MGASCTLVAASCTLVGAGCTLVGASYTLFAASCTLVAASKATCASGEGGRRFGQPAADHERYALATRARSGQHCLCAGSTQVFHSMWPGAYRADLRYIAVVHKSRGYPQDHVGNSLRRTSALMPLVCLLPVAAHAHRPLDAGPVARLVVAGLPEVVRGTDVHPPPLAEYGEPSRRGQDRRDRAPVTKAGRPWEGLDVHGGAHRTLLRVRMADGRAERLTGCGQGIGVEIAHRRQSVVRVSTSVASSRLSVCQKVHHDLHVHITRVSRTAVATVCHNSRNHLATCSPGKLVS